MWPNENKLFYNLWHCLCFTVNLTRWLVCLLQWTDQICGSSPIWDTQVPIFEMFYRSPNTTDILADIFICMLTSEVNYGSRFFLFKKDFNDIMLSKQNIDVGHYRKVSVVLWCKLLMSQYVNMWCTDCRLRFCSHFCYFVVIENVTLG